MKKLANISPFLLLLVPVFIMMLLTVTASSNTDRQNEEVAIKSSAPANGTLVKAVNPFSK